MGNSLSVDETTIRLHEAAERGDFDELKKYLGKGGDLNKMLVNDDFQKPQRIREKFSSEKNERNAFEKLVDTLADEHEDVKIQRDTSPSKKSTLRMNALHRATSRKNNLKIIKFVLERVADVDQQDSQGDTALHYVSMFHNNNESVTTLLKFKPNINLQNDRGETPLFSAVACGCDLKIVEWLLKCGANPNICDVDGDTPLHACALKRGIDPLIPGILLRFGANPNLKNKHGQTALHVAAETTNNAVLLLLKFNAKVRLRDNKGRRPSEVAACEEIRQILLEEENDLLERTTRTSDIIEKEEAHVLNTAPPRSQSVQSWLNRQSSIDSGSEFDRNGIVRSEKGRASQIFHPRRSVMSDAAQSTGRMSIDSYFNKFAGGGGEGVIELPNKKEVIIPPDAMPLGTTLKVAITPSDPTRPVPDFSDLDFNFDLKIRLPGKSLLTPFEKPYDESRSTPAFTGMCLEGNASWQCLREVTEDPGSDAILKFSIKKGTCVPLVKRVSRSNGTITAILENGKSVSDEESNSEDEITNPPDISHEEKFWARQVVVVKEASETSGSYDGSDVDSPAEVEEDPRKQPEGDEMYFRYKECMDELDASLRIQHPIDQELATITEEDGSAQEQALLREDYPKPSEKDFIQNNPNSPNSNITIEEPSLSLDSGYRDSVDLEE